MKNYKRIVLFFVVTVIFAGLVGCNRKSSNDASVSDETAPAKEVTAALTPEATEAPKVTATPKPTEAPKATATPEPIEHGVNYEEYIGVWYLYGGEIDGWEWTAEEEEEVCSIEFLGDHTANYSVQYCYSPDYEDIKTGLPVTPVTDENSWLGKYFVDFGDEYAFEYYDINEDGDLECRTDVYYDEGSVRTISYSLYKREQTVFMPEPLVVPECVQAIMDDAEECNWITVIANPSEEISKACDEAGWELDDETDNEWLDYPIVNPGELIICNTSTRHVSIEIHEPSSDYDPTVSSSDWVAGPFMYWAELEPGEMKRFIVNMVDDPTDATMAIYMTFGDEENSYWMRVYNYGFNYFYFAENE